MRHIRLTFILVCFIILPTLRLYAQGSGQTYTVQPGDTLFSISARFGTTVDAIQQANGITDPTLIYAGQVLKIPGSGGGAAAQPGKPVPAVVVVQSAGAYVVQPGDSLYQIATRFNTTVAAIQQANNLDDPNMISVGQTLHIPGASGSGAPAAAPAVASAPGSVGGYPVVPSISGAVYSHALQVVAVGKRAGNRLNVFSKIGDSITASSYFLTPIGVGALRIGSYGGLQGVVNFFAQATARTHNSFANQSLAARAGWTTSDVLNPAWSTPGVCQSGETPLACELRVTRPSVALIMFGANDVAWVGLDQFRYNLNAIISICEAHGVIPVLSTTLNRLDNPVFAGRIDSYNAAIAQTAQAHSDPLWNYWLAAVALPNSGLSGDRLHPSVPYDGNTAFFDDSHLTAGMTVRNLTALEALNALYSTVLH